MSLHSCPHLMSFFLSRFIICQSSCRPFCFLPCNVSRRTHIFASSSPTSSWVRCLLSHPHPLSATSFMLTSSSISIHFPTLRVCVSMVHSFLSRLRFDRHRPISIIPPLVRVLFIGLVSTILVFHTTHAHVFIFCYRTPHCLIFASLHTLSLCLLRLADDVRILRLSLPSLTNSSPNPTASPYTISHPYHHHPVPILRNDLLVRCVIVFAIQNPARLSVYRIFRAHFLFAAVPRVFLTPSITFTCLPSSSALTAVAT